MNCPLKQDLHIHSNISTCSRDPLQTAERILQYAVENGLDTICLTDHFWDENVPGPIPWYEKQNYAWIAQALPLPQAEGVRFLFGCETELRKDLTLGITRLEMCRVAMRSYEVITGEELIVPEENRKDLEDTAALLAQFIRGLGEEVPDYAL